MPAWNFNAYTGRYRNEAQKFDLILSIEKRELRLRVEDHNDAQFAIVPHNLSLRTSLPITSSLERAGQRVMGLEERL
jgi:hypothetical protein